MVDGKTAILSCNKSWYWDTMFDIVCQSVKNDEKSKSNGGTRGCDGMSQILQECYQYYLMYHFH